MEQKILAHMNKDHKLALEDYLAVYGEVKINREIKNIQLKSIENSHLVIGFTHRDVDFTIEKIISLDPPLQNLGEARLRLVDMAKEAAAARGYSHKQVSEILYPTQPQEFLLLALVAALIFAFFKTDTFYGKWFANIGFLQAVRPYTATIFYGTVAIHVAELALVMMPKLNKYRVPIDYKIEWIIFTLLEGFPAIRRFNHLIAT